MLGILVTSCKNQEPSPSATPTAQAPGAKSYLNWAGTYFGTMPCGDCEGVETFLTLDQFNSYTYSARHVGKEDQAMVQQGKFSFSDDGKILLLEGVLNGPTEYRVGQNVVVPKTFQGNQITDALATQYRLIRTVESILGQSRWNLTELLGKSLERSAAHVRFDVNAKQVLGYGWCNTFNGTYVLEGADKIRFNEMIPTLRTCPDTTVEKQFLNAFQAVTRFQLAGRQLSLSREGLPAMIKFEASEGR